MLQSLLFLRCDKKKPMKLYNILIFRLALALNEHGMKMPVLTTKLFGQNFLPVNILSNVTAACLVLYDKQFMAISFKWLHVFKQ